MRTYHMQSLVAYITDANVGSMIQQMYAGSTASGSYLCWALLYLSVYPHMQERLHNEIDEVIGNIMLYVYHRYAY